jgi:cytochrome c biogenesis protein CcmG/thiol:disulfide interchange protein DsbE
LSASVNRKVLAAGVLVTLPIVGLLFLSLGRNPNRLDAPIVGHAAPPFRLLPVGGGDAVTLAGLRGKPVVLNFWATWCGPCMDEHPAVVRAARAAGSEVQFLGVVYDDPETAVTEFLRRHGSAYPAVMDPGGRTAIAYGVYGVPETYFISAGGVVVDKYLGPLTDQKLAELLTKVRAAHGTPRPEAAR